MSEVPGVTVRRRWEAQPLIERDELSMIYFQSDRLVFTASVLTAGGQSLADPGHEGADEVVYCIEGEVVIEIGEGEGRFVYLEPGDAALIEEGVAHTAYNRGERPARLVWCAAPSLGRPLVYE